ncbi:hypothetical protein BDZ85DRAFT_255451 [Elsinoe ampelina]|uniref:BTB domain-containing protein n=1 Tax=Elsinoe ampelina TaxID=302913 RepID=A0A6A6GR08_9PEZI|nr:hypothetical protein BDZ85DRAFT_255451 [Elsinoe ampelina]
MAEEVIYANGDVVLIATKDDRTIRFRVNSGVLSCASTVFRAMLAGPFSEVQQLTSNGSVEVTVPDDPTILGLLLRCMHFKADILPEDMDSKAILQLAIVGDKYDCQRPLALLASDWAQSVLEKSTRLNAICPNGRSEMLTSAYLMRNKALFKVASAKLVELDEISQTTAGEHCAFLPDYVIFHLERSRNRLLNTYRRYFFEAVNFKCRQGGSHRDIDWLRRYLREHFTWMEAWTVARMKQCRNTFLCDERTTASCFVKCKECDHFQLPQEFVDHKALEEVEQDHGLCLDCCVAQTGDASRCKGDCVRWKT